jgi:Rrf2 family protein
MLSMTSQYALRALSTLAQNGDGMLGRRLSQEASVPSNYLSKIMLAMRDAGFVHATRGAKGGYRLARAAEEIRLIEVVALFEKESARPECVLGNGICSDRSACAAHQRWGGIRSRYIEFLESTTISDISAPSSRPKRK